MATIDRRNILELIGKHRGKYHSCILTCYNFDFSFFEERVLPALRTANIKNINILADGNYLEQAQEMTTGKEFQYNKTYNFLPVYEKGVFHPKIMLMTGSKHGLLIIGSGNITSSGLSTNDEIWGAFHLDNIENENAALFSEVWKYLQTFTSNNYGFLPQKIEWIKKYSLWLDQLPDSKGEIELSSIKQKIQFLSNSNKQSIYQQLITSVPANNLESLTVVSPYYDKKGTLLKQLLKDYAPPTFSCIVDTNSGLLPTALTEEEKESIHFYDWQNCMDDYSMEVNRLHAKMFHFKYRDGSEKMFLGSANASMAAMGGGTIQATNAEAGILISNNKSGNWLRQLKIKLPKKTINISDYSNIIGLDSSTQRKSNFTYRILYSELKGSEINCYLNKISNEDLSIAVTIRNGLITETVAASMTEKIATAKIKDVDAVFKVYLINGKGERVSNYSITHRLEMLLRSNPDPKQEKFDALLEQEFPNGEGVTDLLEFLDYNWADDDAEEQLDLKKSTGGRNQKGKIEKTEKNYQTLTEAEFNKVDAKISMKQSGLLSTTNVKLADFLNLVLSGDTLKEIDYNESEEQKLLEDKKQKGDGDKVPVKYKPKPNALKEKQALYNYFVKLEKSYAFKLENLYKAKAITEAPNESITIKSISKILIALQLIHIYQGRKFMIQHDEADESTIKEEKYLIDGGVYDKLNSEKGFLLNVFGKFLLLSTAGFQNYEYVILNEKMIHYRNQVFERAFLIILNLRWKTEEELKYRMTLLLNLHYYILPNNGTSWFENVNNRIENLIKTGNYTSPYLNINLDYYKQIFLPEFQKWISIFKGSDKPSLIKETTLINDEDLIFRSKLGFNYVHRKISRNPCVLDLKREGLEWSEDGFILDKITYGNKYIQYK